MLYEFKGLSIGFQARWEKFSGGMGCAYKGVKNKENIWRDMVMKSFKGTHTVFWAVLLMVLLGVGAINLRAAGDSKRRVPEGVYIELTRDYYEALKDMGKGSAKVYSNDLSSEYLKEISISSKFMVETNLEILKQQERIIDLLRSVLDKRRK